MGNGVLITVFATILEKNFSLPRAQKFYRSMTNVTNDSVIFRESETWINCKISSYLYIIFILYINMGKMEDISGISLVK